MGRKLGVNLTGPLTNSVHVYKTSFVNLTEEEHASHDKECTRLLEALKHVGGLKNSKIFLGAITLKAFFKMHGLSHAFFMERVYPLIRFIIVSGSKGKMLEAPAAAGLQMFK